MVKRILVLAVILAAAFATVPGNAAVYTRTILAPTAITGLESSSGGNTCTPGEAGCEKLAASRQARCAYLAGVDTGHPEIGQSGGVGNVGYTFTPANVAGTSTFSLVTASGSTGDFDITFYSDLGTCSNQVIKRTTPTPIEVGKNPQPESTHPNYDGYSFHGFGNEGGLVPSDARYAIVTLFGGANASFVLTIN